MLDIHFSWEFVLYVQKTVDSNEGWMPSIHFLIIPWYQTHDMSLVYFALFVNDIIHIFIVFWGFPGLHRNGMMPNHVYIWYPIATDIITLIAKVVLSSVC